MSLLHHHCIRWVLAALFLAVAGLVPLKTVFACAMMGQTLERCCCEQSRERDCQAPRTHADNCCHVVSLPDTHAQGVADSENLLKRFHSEDGKLLLALPPREVGPDPPALADADRSPRFSRPPAWLQGSDTYLLTQRLRN